MELEQNANQFKKLGLNVAAVSYDSVKALHAFAQRKAIHFPLLSDSDSKVIKELGILNNTVAANSPFFGIPNPGIYIVNAKGGIEAKYFEDDYKERFTAAGILLQRFGLMPESTHSEVQGKQLSARTTASNSIVHAGQRIALLIDVTLKPKMHVYAPGVKTYIPIDWEIKPADGWTVHPASYPESQVLFLPAIDEKVPVFEGQFRIKRDITIGQDGKVKPLLDASGKLTLEGTLHYQACDDHMCYLPQDLPLKWTLQYEALDRERVPEDLQRKAPQ